MALPEDIPTLEANSTGNHTRPDNVFCTAHLIDAITTCNVRPDLHPANTDHYPIITELNLCPEHTNPPPRPNYRATNWEKFSKHLNEQLTTLPPTSKINTIPELEKRLEDLTNAILSSIDTHVPACKPSPYAKRWWTPELDEQNASVKHLANTAYAKRQQCAHRIHVQLKEAHNRLATNIQITKEQHWIEYLENVESNNLWDVHKYLVNEPSDSFVSRIPNLRTNTNNPPPPATKQIKKKASSYTKPSSNLPLTNPSRPPWTSIQTQFVVSLTLPTNR